MILLNEDFTFIVQGITGREAVNLTRECLDYGSQDRRRRHPGPQGPRGPRRARLRHGRSRSRSHRVRRPTARSSRSPPRSPRTRSSRRSRTGIKLIVIVTERIPRRDVAEMVELAGMRGARIIGPNCLGLIVPEVCKMGGIGGPAKDAAKAYAPGPVGVMSRSRRDDHRDLLLADRRRPRRLNRGLDRRRRDHRLHLRRADAAVRGGRRRPRRSSSTRSRAAGWRPQLAEWVAEQRVAAADRRLHGGASSWTTRR